ncbi:MAG: hypothetical protein KDK10_07965, partial [Maritimibacter sp.]|nr:hypothetical protein [Maritimibacter sp.]
ATAALGLAGDPVAFDIVPSDPASCGVEAQSFAVPPEATLRVSLAADGATSRVVAHVFAVNQGDLESEVKLRPDEVAQFARTLIDAIEAAHTRLAVEVLGQAMDVIGAELFRLDGRSDLTSLLALSAVTLQSNPAGAFANLSAPARAELAAAHAVVSAQDASAALARVVAAAETAGAKELDIMLIAPVAGRSTQGSVDTCADPTYQNLLGLIDAAAGIDIRLWVFPVARLHAEEQPDLGRMSRLTAGGGLASIQSTRATDNGGLYRCAGLPAGLNIFPYYIEDWRAGVEVPARYGVALTDAMSAILIKLSAEE